MDSDPPFHDTYNALLHKTTAAALINSDGSIVVVEKCDLPLIDLGRLHGSESEKQGCNSEMARAAMEWGFFQVVNHGIAGEILERLRTVQVELFKQPFEKKRKEDQLLNFSAGSYRWGTPTATCLRQLSWSEAFHISVSDISGSDGSLNGLRLLRFSSGDLEVGRSLRMGLSIMLYVH